METSHVVALISKIRGRAYSLIMRELARDGIYDLVPSHGKILDELFRRDSLPMNELARRIRRDKSTITALVDKLTTLGYVRRSRSVGDRRSVLVSLTPKGQKLRPTFERVSAVLLDSVYSGIPQHEREALVGGLEKIHRNLLTYFEQPRRAGVRERGLKGDRNDSQLQ